MHIICPECGFTRDVPEDKLPKRAQLATCPKCGTKFKFRDLSEELAASEDVPSAPPAEQEPAVSQPASGNLWDQLENQTPENQTPENPAPETQAAPEQAAQETAVPSEAAAPQDSESTSAAPKPVKRMYLDTTKAEPTAENISVPEPPPVPETPRTPETPQASETPARSTEKQESAPGSKPVKRLFLDTTKPGAQAESLDGEDDTSEPSAAEEYLNRRGGDPLDDEAEVDVPFERLDTYGFFPGLFETIKRCLTAPGLFFRTMKIEGGLGKPIVFYVLIAEFYALMQLGWSFLGIKGLMDYAYNTQPVPADALGMGLSSFIGLLALPLYFVMTLFIMSGITHFFLTMVKAGNRGFGATFRAVTYASAPLILTIVPLYGEAVGAIWNCILTFMALKNVHRTSYGKITLSYVVMILSFTLFAVLLSFIAGGISPKI